MGYNSLESFWLRAASIAEIVLFASDTASKVVYFTSIEALLAFRADNAVFVSRVEILWQARVVH